MGVAASNMAAAASHACGAPEYTECKLNSADACQLALPEASFAAFALLALPEKAAAAVGAAAPAPVAGAEAPKDIVIQLRVKTGQIAAVYFAAQEFFPSRQRKVWAGEGSCKCAGAECDHGYPKCVSLTTGKPCADCTDPDRNYQHTKDSGFMITDDEKDQVGSTITIRISGADKNLVGGPHFISVVSAGAKPDRSVLTEVELKAFEAIARKEVPSRLGNRGGGDDDDDQKQP